MAFIKTSPAPGASLEARVAQLERNLKIVADLANSALLIAPYQRSPVAGELIAGRITTTLPPGQPSMTLDLMQTAAGKGPIATVSDGTFNRAQMGNLTSYTGPNGVNSPAQYGFRAQDANGNAIFDSMGLISVMVPLVGSGFSNGVITTSSTTPVLIPSTPQTFTLTRTARIMILLTAAPSAFSPAVPTGESGRVTLFQNGATTGTFIFFNNLGFYTYPFISQLSAGTYTFDLRASVATATDSTTVSGAMFLFQVGAA